MGIHAGDYLNTNYLHQALLVLEASCVSLRYHVDLQLMLPLALYCCKRSTGMLCQERKDDHVTPIIM